MCLCNHTLLVKLLTISLLCYQLGLAFSFISHQSSYSFRISVGTVLEANKGIFEYSDTLVVDMNVKLCYAGRKRMSDCFETSMFCQLGQLVRTCCLRMLIRRFLTCFYSTRYQTEQNSRFCKLMNLTKSIFQSMVFAVELWLVTEMKTSVRIQYVARRLHENTRSAVVAL